MNERLRVEGEFLHGAFRRLTYQENAELCGKLDDNALRTLIRYYESQLDESLKQGKISQEEAWDGYFELLNECDWSRFYEDRERILAKIDTKRYNPLASKDPRVIQIVRFRAKMLGLVS